MRLTLRQKRLRQRKKTRRQRGGDSFLGRIARGIGFDSARLIDSLENRKNFDAKVMKKIIEFNIRNNVTESTPESSPEFKKVKQDLKEWVNKSHEVHGSSITALQLAESLLIFYKEKNETFETHPELAHSIKVLKILGAQDTGRVNNNINQIMGHGRFVVADIDSMIKYPESVVNNP